jgi:hypothetical protein
VPRPVDVGVNAAFTSVRLCGPTDPIVNGPARPDTSTCIPFLKPLKLQVGQVSVVVGSPAPTAACTAIFVLPPVSSFFGSAT